MVDSGLSRVPVYEPATGLTRLVTARASRASVDQRRGRAGRTEPGVCHRLWAEAATNSLDPFGRPEILAADLAGLLLDCAAWGVLDPRTLAFLDPPPMPALEEARTMLRDIDAIDAQGHLTADGRRLRALPLPPRLARMVVSAAGFGAAPQAARLAAVLVERGLGGDGADLADRVERFGRDRGQRAADMRRLAEGWARQAARQAGETRPPGPSAGPDLSEPGPLLALAYPDRVARARGRDGEFVLANGRGGRIDPAASLAREPTIVVADLAGSAGNARILAGAAIAPEAIEALFVDRIDMATTVVFDRGTRSLRARALRRLGAVTLAERTLPVPADAASAEILALGVAETGLDALAWSPALTQWRARVAFMRAAEGEPWPDLSDASLKATVVEWLAPEIVGLTSLDAIATERLGQALMGLLPWELRARLEIACPTHVEVPTGSRIPVNYEAEGGPVLAVQGSGIVRARPAPRPRRRAGAAGASPALSGLAADPDHPRPAGVLARLVGGGARRHARSLSAPPLAGGPAGRASDPAGQTARDVIEPSSASHRRRWGCSPSGRRRPRRRPASRPYGPRSPPGRGSSRGSSRRDGRCAP